MEVRTASSNSMGPGMSSAGWGAWFDIFFGSSGIIFLTSCTTFLTGAFWSRFMRFPCSSSQWELRSDENGVFNSRKGFGESKCLEMRSSRDLTRDVELMIAGCPRQLTDAKSRREKASLTGVRSSAKNSRCDSGQSVRGIAALR